MMNFVKSAVLGICILLGVACNNFTWASDSKTKEIRIVTLGGNVTEVVYALGVGDSVVGTDLSSSYPEQAAALQNKVGYHRHVSIEGILSLKPTLVIGTTLVGPPQAIEQLKKAGVPLVLLNGQSTAEAAKERIQEIAKLLDRKKEGKKLVESISRQLGQVAVMKNRKKEEKVPKSERVMFLMNSPSSDRFLVAGSKTGADYIIGLTGAENVFPEFEGYKPVGSEAIAKANPDYILVPQAQGNHGIANTDELLKNPAIASTKAGQNQKIITIDMQLLLGFGPRIGDAALWLSQALETSGEG